MEIALDLVNKKLAGSHNLDFSRRENVLPLQDKGTSGLLAPSLSSIPATFYRIEENIFVCVRGATAQN